MKHVFAISCFFICWCACAPADKFVVSSETQTSVMDESMIVLRKFPAKTKAINDSAIAVINAGQDLSQYTVYSGKNSANFTLTRFHFDSLIQATYGKKLTGSKKYTYENGFEMNGSGYQLINFQHSRETFHILVSVLTSVEDLKDSSLVDSLKNGIDFKQRKDTAEAKIIVMDYLNFLFCTDENFQLKKIIPLYSDLEIRKQGYYPYYHKGFHITDSLMYVPVLRSSDYPKLSRELIIKDEYFMAITDLRDANKTWLAITNEQLNFAGFRLQDFFTSSYSFSPSPSGLICNGKEVYDFEAGIKILRKKEFRDEEWIDNFVFRNHEDLVLLTQTLERKPDFILSGKSYPVDSIACRSLLFFDPKKNNCLSRVQLPYFTSDACLTTDHVIFISKDDQHYYINRISYHD